MIRTTGLTKDFVVSRKETVHAVRGIDLTIEDGEMVAVLGPNGAGKTTTMRMLTTLVRPTAGTARVAGYDVVEHPTQVRRRLGYVGQGNGAGHTQRVVDELAMQGQVYGLDRRAARARAEELLTDLQLDGLGRRKVSDLSGGQRRRLDVALGMVHAPSLLVLDEPTTGLDPQNRANLWHHIRRLREQREITVVLTTHYMDEADGAAGRVIIVDHGQVIADDTADALKRELAGDLVEVRVARRDGPDGRDDVATLARLAERLPGARDVAVEDDAAAPAVRARVADGAAAVPLLLRAADAAGLTVVAARADRPTLDDVFLSLTGRSLREGASAGATGTDPDDDGSDHLRTTGGAAARKDAA